MTTFDPQMGFVSEAPSAEVVELRAQVANLEEAFDEAAQSLLRVRSEDEGWSIFGQVKADNGFSLTVIQDVAKKAEVQSLGNPLLKHGFDLRYNPIFSRGFQLAFKEGDKLKPRYQRKMDNLSVQEVLFSADGIEELERTCYNVGNLFVAYNRTSGDLLRIPFDQITNRAINPDLPSQTAYYQWKHTRYDFDGTTTPISEWIPVVEWWSAGKDKIDQIANDPVNHDWIVVDMRVNVPTTGHWGIPDVFAALPYAWAYSEYIRDASSLLKAFNMIAWKVVGKTKGQAAAAGVALAGTRKAGGVASMTAGTDLQSMPKAGQVDMTDGQALAAMVASALGVSTNALLTMANGGGIAAQSLDGPTVAMARERQKRWTRFYERVFMAMGIEDVSINFPKITEDPIYRVVASLATGRATGAIWADEYRAAFLEAMSLKPTHTDAPDVQEYAQAQNALGFIAQMEAASTNPDQPQADPLARQGNAGVAGKLGETDNAGLRKQDKKAGGGTQTDLVG